MPLLWTLDQGVLVLTVVGESTLAEARAVIGEAVVSPEFREGTAVVINSLDSATASVPDAADIRGRIGLLSSLPSLGFERRIYLVVRLAEPVRFGLARQISQSVDPREVEIEVLGDLATAMAKARRGHL